MDSCRQQPLSRRRRLGPNLHPNDEHPYPNFCRLELSMQVGRVGRSKRGQMKVAGQSRGIDLIGSKFYDKVTSQRANYMGSYRSV